MSTKVILPSGGAAVAADDEQCAAYFGLVRGTPAEAVRAAMSVMLAAAADDVEAIADVFVARIHSRDCRDGKGERQLAVDMMLALANLGYPATCARLVSELPTFGSWRDLTAIVGTFHDAVDGSAEAMLRDAALNTFRRQLIDVDANAEKPSLAAKWAPREKTASDKAAALLARRCFGDKEGASALAAYRRLVASLNKRLKTPEVLMCSGRYAELEPRHLPAALLKRSRKALLNEQLNGGGIRKADDGDRMECRERLLEVLADKSGKRKRVNGAAVQPHELVADYVRAWFAGEAGGAIEPDAVLEAQWEDTVERLRKELRKKLILVHCTALDSGWPKGAA